MRLSFKAKCVSVFGVLLAVVLTLGFYHPVSIYPATKENIWIHIKRESEQYALDPEFVYAIAFAESSLQPLAYTGKARGMMQMTSAAWKDVTDIPYRDAWNWQVNVAMSVRYLDYCRSFLKKHKKFSYPLLAASYRYGINHVKKHDFKIDRLETPKNKIYQKLFKGISNPVQPPLVGLGEPLTLLSVD